MNRKVILVSIDGMRPDGLLQCGNPFVEELMKKGAYTLEGSSVNPSVTLPCHMSIFHSVTPQRHGVSTNFYAPMVRPVDSLFKQIKNAGGRSAMYYGWEPLRDICPPRSLRYATFIQSYTDESVDTLLADECERILTEKKPDFAFLYMVDTDEKGGHDNGWMSEEYLRRISMAIDNVKKLIEKFSGEYSIIIMSDHGGHDRGHGSLMPEDMTIPLIFAGGFFVFLYVVECY